MGCIVHKTRPCVQDDRVGSHFDLSVSSTSRLQEPSGCGILVPGSPAKAITHIGLDDQARAVAAIPAPRPPQADQLEEEAWEYIGSKTCGKLCHLPSSAGNTVAMELATVNDENPCGDRGLDAVCPPVVLNGTDGEKWRRRESNPRVQSRNSQIAQRLWNMLQDVGVSWKWTDDANRQPMALENEKLAAVITAWPLLSADLRQAILAIVRSADMIAEASCAATE